MGKKNKKKKEGIKTKCCDKYIKKGEHKRCNRCPCLDMTAYERQSRFLEMGLTTIKKAPEVI